MFVTIELEKQMTFQEKDLNLHQSSILIEIFGKWKWKFCDCLFKMVSISISISSLLKLSLSDWEKQNENFLEAKFTFEKNIGELVSCKK